MNAHRLELLLIAQQRMRAYPDKANANNLFEIERAIDEIQGGCSCAHTECVERWVAAFLSQGVPV